MTELTEQIELIDEADRIAMVIEHPNGYSTMYFDECRGELHAEPSYMKLFRAWKNDDAGEMTEAEEELEADGYLVSDLVFPGIYDLEEVVWYDGDIPYASLSGYDFRVDNILTTNLPIY